ncbi:MAG: nidogen-like domain-containing protein [Deltaproteobacteria bacterium]|nr:nidogen-like domain-containing protein [Myxococcales bacterium]MDP3212849.1 nidogen-like domain-containing protein [Deltaproteobacteria bacterium]
MIHERCLPLTMGLLALVAGCSSPVVTGPGSTPDAGRSDVLTTLDVPAVDAPAGDVAPIDAKAVDVSASDVPELDVAQLDAPVPPDAAGPDDALGPTDAPAPSDLPAVDASTSRCASDRDCLSLNLLCDPLRAVCVDCVRDADCLTAGTVCASNRCVPDVRCTSSRTCPGQVCDVPLGRCVDCLANTDCFDGQVCRASVCVPRPPRCTTNSDCGPPAPLCNAASGGCVACLSATDCPSGERCVANACVLCTPGAATCTSPTARSVCNPDGRGTTESPCAAGPNRVGGCAGAGVCHTACVAGFFECDGVAANGCESSVACASRLLSGFGGPTGFGLATNCLHPNDDGSYAGPTGMGAVVAVDIRPAFAMGLNFFGTTYNSVYVNTNGNITFRAALPSYTPEPFPVASQPMIAPWWADVDTRGGGQPSRNSICFATEPGRFIATWFNVGYFNAHNDRLNSFQLVLTDRSAVAAGDFDVEFRYDRCEWITGDASGGTGGFGGTPAQVGFDAGDRMNFVALPASRTPAILDVCRSTNVGGGPPGIWRFTVRRGVVTAM